MSTLDTATIQWLGVSPDEVYTRVEGAPQPVSSLLTLFSWTSFPVIARGAARRWDGSFNSKSFRFSDNREADEPEWHGVMVENPAGSVVVDRAGFVRLVARFVRTVVDGATRDGDKVLNAPWWPEIVSLLAELEGPAAEPDEDIGNAILAED